MKKILSLSFTFLMVFSYVQGNNLNWSTPPTLLSGGSTNGSDPQIAIDPNGNAVSAWVENSTIKTRYKPVSGTWSGVTTLSSTGGSSVKLVLDNNGNATAVWLENGIVKASIKPFSGSWGASTSLSNVNASSPALTVDDAGNLIAVWVRAGDVETSTKLVGKNWQNVSKINSTNSANPVIDIAGAGANTRAVVVWQGTDDNSNVIFSSTKLIGGSWNSDVIISDSNNQAAKPFVSVDANGNAQAIWFSYNMVGSNYSNVVVQSATRSAASGEWDSPTALSLPGIRNPLTLTAEVAYDSVGNAVAIWNNSYDDVNFIIQSAVKPYLGTWSDPIELIAANEYAISADLSATYFGDVLALYMFYNGATLMIQTTESDINGFLNNSWSVPITISKGSNNAYPKIAASLSGNQIHAAAVWVNYNGANNLIVAATGTKNLIFPPSNLSVSQSFQNFGAFKDYYNTLTWNASLDPNVAGYLIFRNGVFLAQVGADVLSFNDHNRTQNGAVTYSVTAIDSQQTQSRTVSVAYP